MGFRAHGSAVVVWLAPRDFAATSGAPAAGIIGGLWQELLFDGAVSEQAAAAVMLPPQWRAMDIDVYWTNAGVGAGGVVWVASLDRAVDGDDLTVVDGGGTNNAAGVAPAQNVLEVTRLTPNNARAVDATQLLNVRITRLVTDGGDTLANDAGLLGVLLSERA